ncbi:MAG: hypothetical protein IT445_11425 [Phycisphaeraceae bacterium]|nr:hypothetical protein [Phycisphaeraceae bacterium]
MNGYATTAGLKLFYDAVDTADPQTALAGIDEIGGLPAQEVDEFETTRVDQEASAGVHDWFKQFAPDHIDPGTMEFKLGLSEAQLETLYGLVRQMKSWKILFSSGGKMVCNGFIKKVGPEANKGGEIKVPVTIRWSGKPTFTKYVAP